MQGNGGGEMSVGNDNDASGSHYLTSTDYCAELLGTSRLILCPPLWEWDYGHLHFSDEMQIGGV